MTPQNGLTNLHQTRHLCIHDKHQDGCEHFRAPPHPDPTVTYDNPSGFMSLQDLEDMNI